MVPFIYLAIKSVYRSKGKTLKKIMWCDDDTIKPYFTEAGRNITYGMIEDAIKNGAETFQEVQDATGAAKGCGKCKDFLICLIRDIKEEIKNQ